MSRLAALFAVAVFAFSACEKQEKNFETLLIEIDESLLRGAIARADKEIREAVDSTSGRAEWLSLLKRAYSMGLAQGNYETLYLVSKAGIERLSGAEEIAALCVYASLRTGKVDMAYRYAEEYLVSEKWRPLKEEAVLRKSALDRDVLFEKEEESPIFAAVYSEEPDKLAIAADLLEDSRLRAAAALRYAENGDLENAVKTLERNRAEYPELMALFYYDAGRFADAREILGQQPAENLHLLLADTNLKLGKEESALSLYGQYIDKHPQKSWIPYVNSAYIYEKRGNSEKALQVVENGISIFPENKQLLLSEIIIKSENGGAPNLDQLVQSYKEKYPSDPEMAIIMARLYPTKANRLRLEDALWSAIIVNPENSQIAGFLGASLIASNDTDGIKNLVKIWEKANGETAWSLFLRGYQDTYSNETALSKAAFERSFKLQPRWETAYNLAVLSAGDGDFDGALEYLRRAENTLEGNAEDARRTKALLRAATAGIHYRRGDFDGAAREASYALDLDPGSDRAAVILSSLEQEGE